MNDQQAKKTQNVHVVTVTGREFIGTLLREWWQGDTRHVELSKPLSYGLAPVPNGQPPQPIAHPAFVLEGCETMEAAVVSVTYVRQDSVQFTDLLRMGERLGKELRGVASGLVGVA